MRTSYTVIVPECLMVYTDNTAAYVVESKQQAIKLAQAFSKASRQAVEVKRQPKPFPAQMLYLQC